MEYNLESNMIRGIETPAIDRARPRTRVCRHIVGGLHISKSIGAGGDLVVVVAQGIRVEVLVGVPSQHQAKRERV